MEAKERIEKDGWQNLLRSLPDEKPSDGLDARIMEQVRQAKCYTERRSDRWFLAWAIGLSAVVLGAGVWALYAYIDIDWGRLIPKQLSMPEITPEKLLGDLVLKTSPEASWLFKVLPFAGIVLLLLLGDLLFRRYFFLKRHHDQ